MFTIDQIIQQLERFSAIQGVNADLEKLEEFNSILKQMNPSELHQLSKTLHLKKANPPAGETKTVLDRAKQVDTLIGPLRTRLTHHLKEEVASEQHSALQDIYYDALIALAEILPLNMGLVEGESGVEGAWEPICVITNDPIPPEKRLTLSTGHCFNVDLLHEWTEKSDKVINPYDNTPFTEQDINRINGRLKIEDYIKDTHDLNCPVNRELGNTLLIQRIALNDTPTAMQIIDAGADVNLALNNGQTPLMIAAIQGNERLIQYLLSHGAFINKADNTGMTAWQYAMLYEHPRCIHILVEHNADDTISDEYVRQKRQQDFFVAITKGDLPLVKRALESNPAYLTAIDNNGSSASALAVKNDQVACLQYLKEKGCQLDVQLVLQALQDKSEKCFQFLFRDTELKTTLQQNQYEVEGIPLVYIAAALNLPKPLNTLIQAGANVNACYEGVSSLYIATQENNPECVSMLLKTDADIDFKTNPEGTTLVYQAIYKENDACLQLLVNHRANLNEPNGDTMRPVSLAAILGKKTSLAILLKAGVEQNVRYLGYLPAHLAAYYDQLDCLKLLLKTGFDITQKTDDGKTIQDIVTEKPDSACYAFLQQFTQVETLPDVDSYIPSSVSATGLFSRTNTPPSHDKLAAPPPRTEPRQG